MKTIELIATILCTVFFSLPSSGDTPLPGSDAAMKVDFSYAFSTPHRMAVALPDSSNKTLLDVFPDSLRMAWTYDNLIEKPLLTFLTPKTEWEVRLKPELDGQPLGPSQWTRAEGWLPVLVNTYGNEKTSMRLEAAGGDTAAMIRIEVANRDDKTHQFRLRCEKPGNFTGINPAWVQPEWDCDVLLAGWLERTDRILVFAVGGDQKPVLASTTITLIWDLKPGETRIGWIVRPYKAYQSFLPVLRKKDWAREFEEAKAAWRALIARAAQIDIPDKDVQNAFYAGLADVFVMREPAAEGYIATCPGTEGYRAANSGEAMLACILLDQAGLHEEAGEGLQLSVDAQAPDGNWAYPQGWEHYWWGASGFKSWAVMEHYLLTGDKDYLAAVYPRMLASSQWQERQRARTRVLENGVRPLTYGLMPRGMGDCGLMDGEDLYGVFLPHNMLAVFGDALALKSAEILGKNEDLALLRPIHQTALGDLMQAIEKGAISEDGYRWIPGVAGKTCGSRWGALYADFPISILPHDHELITGTIRKIESRMSPGGIPVHTGWMKDGMWVAITLDNLAEVLLLRVEGDAAAQYLYATLNHGTPLYSWCEERGQEAGAKECTGDRQHLWTPIAVSRFIRDALAMEDGDSLHLARGTARQWLAGGQPLAVRAIQTHFGAISYKIRYDSAAQRVAGSIELVSEKPAPRIVLHVRLPGGLKIQSLANAPGAKVNGDGTAIEWSAIRGTVSFEAEMGF